jgi:hypothetical protein
MPERPEFEDENVDEKQRIFVRAEDRVVRLAGNGWGSIKWKDWWADPDQDFVRKLMTKLVNNWCES